jgi:hypothetical protein
MAAREKADDRQADGFVLAPDDLADITDDGLKFISHGRTSVTDLPADSQARWKAEVA